MLLAINTASSQTGIALIKGDDVLQQQSWLSENNEAEKLMPAIHEMLNGDYSPLETLLVVKGPGSFTGLRVGVTVANTMAYLNSLDLYGLSTFDYHWAAAAADAALLVYAGQGGVYYQKTPDGKPEIISVDQLANHLAQEGITACFGDISEQQRAAIADIPFIQTEDFAKIAAQIDLTQLEATRIVKPLYIKSPVITPSKKKLFQ